MGRMPLADITRVTIEVLAINAPEQLEPHEVLLAEGVFPPV